MTKTEIIAQYRYMVGDPAGVNQLFDNDYYEAMLNNALLSLYGEGYTIDDVSDLWFPKYSAWAEFNYYYLLARDTAFYFKYKEAQGDTVDQTKTPDFFLRLAMAKEKLYFKLYAAGNVLGITAVGKLFSVGE
jgi:hypothetical protein